MIEEFRDIFLDRYRVIEEIKAQEKKIIGWSCSYVPEEIIYGAGMLPVRVLGGAKETPIADAHLYSNICSFLRNCLEEGFRGRYHFLDGFVACNTCDHKKRLYDVWTTYLKTPFTDILGIPCKYSEGARVFFKKELIRFKRNIEESFGIAPIPEEALHNAIEVYNETRTLLKQLYQLRKEDSPPISGAEAMEVLLAGMVIPKDHYNQMLRRLLKILPERPRMADSNNRIRLLITGSILDNPEYLRIIEDLGGLIVIDDLCSGLRYFEDLVEPQEDSMEALAQRYLGRIPCPNIHPARKRLDYLRDLVKAFKVRGVIYTSIKFCDNNAVLYPIIRDEMAKLGVRTLKLEREYLIAGIGQMKTRIEAFFESMEG